MCSWPCCCWLAVLRALWLARVCVRMMIRHVPLRCQQEEVDRIIQLVTPNFQTQMPRSSSSKCKGYAFVEVDSPATMQRVAEFLWQAKVPTRHSSRPLKIHPANLQAKRLSL